MSSMSHLPSTASSQTARAAREQPSRLGRGGGRGLRWLGRVGGLALAGLAACGAVRAQAPKAEEPIVLPKLMVEAVRLGPGNPWRHAQAAEFELLTDVDESDAQRFAMQFSQFLCFVRAVCPELLLPAGTRLTIMLASAEKYDALIPLRLAPNGQQLRPTTLTLRGPDTTILAVRYAAVRAVGRGADRVALTGAQCGYVTDPRFPRETVLYVGRGTTEYSFHDAIGESRPLFARPRQAALKQSLIRVVAVMASALNDTVTYHDFEHRWSAYFPDTRTDPASEQRAWRVDEIPLVLPPLGQVFTTELDSPAWADPMHRLERDAFVHWCLLAGDRARGRALLDLLLRGADGPVTAEEFQDRFGRRLAEVQTELVSYLEPRAGAAQRPRPAQCLWDALPYRDPNVPRTLELREATPVEIARTKAEVFNALGLSERAGAALTPTFKRDQPTDPELLLAAGGYLQRGGDVTNAIRSYRAALRAGSTRPLAYLQLARLLWERDCAAGAEPVAAARAAPVLALLHEARTRVPALRQVYLSLVEVWAHLATPPGEDELAALDEAAAQFPQDDELAWRAAELCWQCGSAKRAEQWIQRGLAATDRRGEARFRQLQVALAGGVRGRDGVPAAKVIEAAVAAATVEADSAETAMTNRAIPGLDLELVWVGPGAFFRVPSVGSGDQPGDTLTRPRVVLRQGYWLGKTEVTQAQWSALMDTSVTMQRDAECPWPKVFADGGPMATGTKLEQRQLKKRMEQRLPIHGEGELFPMEYVSWDEAAEFCRRLTKRERSAGRLPAGFVYALPTEAQWELACRAGGDRRLTREELEATGWLPQIVLQRWMVPFSPDSYVAELHPVARKQPNAWGFYDMIGNVSEWCRDWYAEVPNDGTLIDPTGPDSGDYRVVRGGGSWGVEAGVRVADPSVRSRDVPSARFGRGFRVALVKAP